MVRISYLNNSKKFLAFILNFEMYIMNWRIISTDYVIRKG